MPGNKVFGQTGVEPRWRNTYNMEHDIQEDWCYKVKCEYEYDSNGNIAVKHVNAVEPAIYLDPTDFGIKGEVDPLGLCTIMQSKWNGAIPTKIEYEYDGQGRITVERYYGVNWAGFDDYGEKKYTDEALDYRCEYQYDAQGNVEKKCFIREGEEEGVGSTEIITYGYDVHGNVVSEQSETVSTGYGLSTVDGNVVKNWNETVREGDSYTYENVYY